MTNLLSILNLLGCADSSNRYTYDRSNGSQHQRPDSLQYSYSVESESILSDPTVCTGRPNHLMYVQPAQYLQIPFQFSNQPSQQGYYLSHLAIPNTVYSANQAALNHNYCQQTRLHSRPSFTSAQNPQNVHHTNFTRKPIPQPRHSEYSPMPCDYDEQSFLCDIRKLDSRPKYSHTDRLPHSLVSSLQNCNISKENSISRQSYTNAWIRSQDCKGASLPRTRYQSENSAEYGPISKNQKAYYSRIFKALVECLFSVRDFSEYVAGSYDQILFDLTYAYQEQNVEAYYEISTRFLSFLIEDSQLPISESTYRKNCFDFAVHLLYKLRLTHSSNHSSEAKLPFQLKLQTFKKNGEN